MSALGHFGYEPIAEGAALQILDVAKSAGINVVFTSLLGTVTPLTEQTPMNISTIADTWIHVSNTHHAGERNRALTIIKSRGTAHSNQVRELVLSNDGITLADVYTAGGEVLMGTLRWEKENEERRARAAAKNDAVLRERRAELALAETKAHLATLAHAQAIQEGELQQIRERNEAVVDSRAVEDEQLLLRRHADQATRFTLGDRRWRIRGLLKNTTPSALRINALVSRGEAFHVDTLELYSARERVAYITQASTELGVEERVIKRDLGVVLLKLEERQEQAQKQKKEPESTAPKLSESEQREALELLRDPKLLDRIASDLEVCGIVGERVNKLTSYLAAVSRKLERPLAIVIQSSPAAGKSSLMDAVLKLVPEEERIAYSAMTAQSLFYMGQHDLKHKVLAIAEEEGAKEASYALKLLQSEGRVKIASTTKDPQTGQFVTRDHELEGPVMIFLTTTAIEVDEELLNRCIVLTVDEGREQTRAIHELQRLLRTLPVVNPFAEQLKFPDHQTRMRRDHTKYLALIEAVALLHQYQRPVKEVAHRGKRLRYVEVTASDIAIANRLCGQVLGRTLDELPPQTRRLLELLEVMVTEEAGKLGMDANDYRFMRRTVRERTAWGDTQLRVHLERLIELEYVLVHRGRQGQGFLYELGYAGQGRDGERFVLGLVDVGVGAGTDADTMSTSRGKEITSRVVSGGVAGRGARSLDGGNPSNTHEEAGASSALRGVNGREHQRAGVNGASYSQPRGNGRGKTIPLDANPQ